MGKVLLIGEPMALFIAQEYGQLHEVENFKKSAAGAELNVAIGLTRLGHQVSYMTKLGQDPFGTYLTAFIKSQNIDTQYIQYDEERLTGFQLKGKTKEGDPKTANYRKGSAASQIEKSDLEAIQLENFNHFHLTGIFPALSKVNKESLMYLLEQAKAQGMTTSFDPNLRPTLWRSEEEMVKVMNEFAFKCDTVLPGIGEGKILTSYTHERDIANFYLEQGVKEVVIKLGEKGAYFKNHSEEGYVPGYYVEKVIDTVGAGDGFAVGYISGLLESLETKVCLQRATAIGAIQVSHSGDNEGLPTQEALAAYMSGHLNR